MRIARSLALAGSLLVTAAAMSGATTKSQTPTKKADNGMITCPIMHSKVARKKAIKVVADNGKSTYVCCQSCVAEAKKQLMAKK
jgi:hypothetical protein